jgi:SAM-dependent methyltransferase
VDQPELDARIQDYYANVFDESQRLRTRSAQGRLEFDRVQELIGSRIPARSRVLDVGGATGVHAAALTLLGHDVVLVDPVESHVELARQQGNFAAEVGDARDLGFADDSFDTVLLFGPLYHLASDADRIRCLEEASRVARAEGWVFVSAIPRFAHHAMMTLGRPELQGQRHPPEMIALLERGEPPASSRFPGGHFHTGEELFEELTAAGLREVEVCAIEGPNGLALESFSQVEEGVHQAALTLVRKVGNLPGIRDMTNHLMGMGRVH